MTTDITKPVQTRDGCKARIVCTDVKGDQPIAALVMNDSGEEYVYYYYADGRVYADGTEYPLDLVNVPEQTVWYVRIHHSGNAIMSNYLYAKVPQEDQIKCTFEDGKLVKAEIVK